MELVVQQQPKACHTRRLVAIPPDSSARHHQKSKTPPRAATTFQPTGRRPPPPRMVNKPQLLTCVADYEIKYNLFINLKIFLFFFFHVVDQNLFKYYCMINQIIIQIIQSIFIFLFCNKCRKLLLIFFTRKFLTKKLSNQDEIMWERSSFKIIKKKKDSIIIKLVYFIAVNF